MIDYQYKKALLHHKRGAFWFLKPFKKYKGLKNHSNDTKSPQKGLF